MKEFNYLHLSGFAASGLLLACLAQQWFGDHRVHNHAGDYRPSAATIRAIETEHQEAVSRLAVIHDDRQKEEAQRAHAQVERQRHEQAWKAFYTPPASCHNPSTTRMFNACADEHIRAKREFEQGYAANLGTLRPFQSAIASSE